MGSDSGAVVEVANAVVGVGGTDEMTDVDVFELTGPALLDDRPITIINTTNAINSAMNNHNAINRRGGEVGLLVGP